MDESDTGNSRLVHTLGGLGSRRRHCYDVERERERDCETKIATCSCEILHEQLTAVDLGSLRVGHISLGMYQLYRHGLGALCGRDGGGRDGLDLDQSAQASFGRRGRDGALPPTLGGRVFDLIGVLAREGLEGRTATAELGAGCEMDGGGCSQEGRCDKKFHC